jgi:hypothetical protein
MWRSQNGSGKTMEMDGETQRNNEAKDPKTESNIEHIQQMSNEKEKEKRGRPEEENFSQETGLPGYPTGLTGVHTFPHEHEVICSHLTPLQREKLLSLLLEFESLFDISPPMLAEDTARRGEYDGVDAPNAMGEGAIHPSKRHGEAA